MMGDSMTFMSALFISVALAVITVDAAGAPQWAILPTAIAYSILICRMTL